MYAYRPPEWIVIAIIAEWVVGLRTKYQILLMLSPLLWVSRDALNRQTEAEKKWICNHNGSIGWLIGFNGISTSIGYLMPKPVYTYVQFVNT